MTINKNTREVAPEVTYIEIKRVADHWPDLTESVFMKMTDRPFSEADEEEVRALFLRQAEAETAHDIEGIDAVLARNAEGEPDRVNFVARAYRFWGRDAVLEHFRSVFAGSWRFEPEIAEIRICPISADVAHIYAPTQITVGAPGAPAATFHFLVNEFAVRTPAGWRISTIVPVPG